MKTILLTAVALASQLTAQQAFPDLSATSTPGQQRPAPVTARALPVAPGQAVAPPRSGAAARTTAIGRMPSTVVFDRPRAGELWALGADWKASFDGRGTTFVPFFGSKAPRNFPLRIELASASVGGVDLALVDGEPQVDRGVVSTARGALTETITTAMASIEQAFVFEQLPNRGAVHVDIALTGDLVANTTADGLEFTNEHGAVDYRKAMAVDAAGRRLALPIDWDGDSAHITIPSEFVARAELPLVLDPIVNSRPGIAGGVVETQGFPDVATLQSPDKSIIVWLRQFSAGDQDCFAEVLNADLSYALGAVITVDYTSLDWGEPKVASNGSARNFLVVSQLDLPGGPTWIGGRTVTEFGWLGSVLDIERAGFGGLPGNKFRPDVGGDPLAGPFGRGFMVVWEHPTTPTNHDIYYRLLTSSGAPVGPSAVLLSGDAQSESYVAISKSNWEVDWHVVWQRQYPVFLDEDIWGARVAFNGSLAAGPYLVAGSAANETRPAVSSPMLVQGFVNGANALVAFEQIFSGQYDIVVAALDYTGGVAHAINLSATEIGGAFALRNQIQPEVDTDGNRFVIGYIESTGSDFDTYVTTLAFDPAINTMRLDESHVQLGGTPGVDDFWPRIAACHSGGGRPSPRYIVTGYSPLTNDIPVWDYGGYVPGAFFSTFPSQCGNLTITPSGQPVIGQRITFTVNTALPSGTVFGVQGTIGLSSLGCNCNLGVVGGVFAPNPLSIDVPSTPSLVGSVFSVQGYGYSGANCLGLFDLTDTIDFEIR